MLKAVLPHARDMLKVCSVVRRIERTERISAHIRMHLVGNIGGVLKFGGFQKIHQI